MEKQICPICNHAHFNEIKIFNDFRVEFCGECGHGMTLPQLSPAELDQLYNKHYFDDQYEDCLYEKKEIARKEKQEDHRVRVLRQHLSKGRLLDVGCGLGFFLSACKEFFTPYGFDVSISNKDSIENRLGIQLFADMHALEDFTEKQGKFNAITFWHSLEHFIDPSATLRQFSSLCADEGIVIIDVPVHDSIDAAMKGNSWEGWQIPFHQHHFTSNSLDQLLSSSGFTTLYSHSYRSGHVRDTLKKTWYLRPFARSISKRFQGGSKVVVCTQSTSARSILA